jgi:para-nitrobenzyl esterase
VLLPQPALADPPLTVPVSSCPGRTVTGFVGDFPRGPTGNAAVGSMRQFVGIPYAKPPTGADRWQPPKTYCWSGDRAASTFGEVCPQSSGGNPSGSEDCLFLNVFTPPTGTYSNLPVMVYIHDGSFISGKGSFWAQNPIDLVNQGVVVVTINYRLGALGFLAHSALDKVATKNTGNYGFLDQQAALKWVKSNIAGFGGDPRNVTIFGSSAGGISVLVHLVSPLSSGLFHKAIVQSGSLYQKPTLLADAEALGATFATRVGCDGGAPAQEAACLRALPFSTILANQALLQNGDIEMLRQDGVVLTDSLMNLLMAGSFRKVPIINGSNRDEHGQITEDKYLGTGGRCGYTSNLVPNGQDTFPGAVSYHNALLKLFGPASRLAPLVEAEYPSGPNSLSANATYVGFRTDFIRACRTLRVNDWIALNGGKIFAYEFNDRKAPKFLTGPVTLHNGSDFPLGAYLGAETQYLFKMPGTVLCNLPYPGMSTDQRSLSAAMVRYWTTFAKTGNPTPAGGVLPLWPRYTMSNRSILSLEGSTPKKKTAATFDAAHKCSSFWNPIIE